MCVGAGLYIVRCRRKKFTLAISYPDECLFKFLYPVYFKFHYRIDIRPRLYLHRRVASTMAFDGRRIEDDEVDLLRSMCRLCRPGE